MKNRKKKAALLSMSRMSEPAVRLAMVIEDLTALRDRLQGSAARADMFRAGLISVALRHLECAMLPDAEMMPIRDEDVPPMTEWYSITENCIEREIADRLRVAAAIWNLKPEARRVYLVKPAGDGRGSEVIGEIPASELREVLSLPRE